MASKSTHIRIRKDTRQILRKAFPNADSDDARIRSLYDGSIYKYEPMIDKAGRAIWGASLWENSKNAYKKKKR